MKTGRKNRGRNGPFRRPTNSSEKKKKENKTSVFLGACHKRFSVDRSCVKIGKFALTYSPVFQSSHLSYSPNGHSAVQQSRILIAKTAFSCFCSSSPPAYHYTRRLSVGSLPSLRPTSCVSRCHSFRLLLTCSQIISPALLRL